MSNNESVQLFTRIILEKHTSLVAASNNLMQAISAENVDAKYKSATNLMIAVESLRSILSNQDVPDWLSGLDHNLNLYISKQIDSYIFLGRFLNLKTKLDSHIWSFQTPTEAAFDFDAIYERFKKESKLPTLFEEIIKILEEIAVSEDVDSIVMHKSLGKVIATIKKGKDGSYFSLNGAWEFLLSFMKNYMWSELSKIPVLGTLLETLKNTISEVDAEMVSLHQNMQTEMSRIVESEIKPLKKAEFPFITYTPAGNISFDSISVISRTV